MKGEKARADKKIKIVKALNRCLQKKPFDRTSIKDIASEAGVNHGLLHYYFKNKEDILIHYIEYVVDHYKSLFDVWLDSGQAKEKNGKAFVKEFFKFINQKITMDKELSFVFIEIWEIAVYNPKVKSILRKAYTEWISTLSDILFQVSGNRNDSQQASTAIVAFLEGVSLFSIILSPDSFDVEKTLDRFQDKIIEQM